ncbi:hypothetical protein E0H43_16945 [Rhizobium leguminosarum bv. viciae]|nr:hypothetical protein E0H43_16945 [Rhizobium leguminosarum bv. viciae]
MSPTIFTGHRLGPDWLPAAHGYRPSPQTGDGPRMRLRRGSLRATPAAAPQRCRAITESDFATWSPLEASRSRLRFIHLAARLEVTRILDASQIAAYAKLRSYSNRPRYLVVLTGRTLAKTPTQTACLGRASPTSVRRQAAC